MDVNEIIHNPEEINDVQIILEKKIDGLVINRAPKEIS